MRLLNRQKQKIKFKNLVGTQPILNEDGLRTGSKEQVYTDFKDTNVSISITKSQDSFEPFGTTSVVFDLFILGTKSDGSKTHNGVSQGT